MPINIKNTDFWDLVATGTSFSAVQLHKKGFRYMYTYTILLCILFWFPNNLQLCWSLQSRKRMSRLGCCEFRLFMFLLSAIYFKLAWKTFMLISFMFLHFANVQNYIRVLVFMMVLSLKKRKVLWIPAVPFFSKAKSYESKPGATNYFLLEAIHIQSSLIEDFFKSVILRRTHSYLDV